MLIECRLSFEPNHGRLTWYTDCIDPKYLNDIQTLNTSVIGSREDPPKTPECRSLKRESILHLRRLGEDENPAMKAALERVAENNKDVDFYSVLYSANFRKNTFFAISKEGFVKSSFHIDDNLDLDKQLDAQISKAHFSCGIGIRWDRSRQVFTSDRDGIIRSEVLREDE